MCIMPVGEGAIRVRTGRSGIELEGSGEAGGNAGAAPLSTPLPRAASLRRAWAALCDQAEAQADRWTLWTPVAFGAGCAAYFTLLREPPAAVAGGLLASGRGPLGAAGGGPGPARGVWTLGGRPGGGDRSGPRRVRLLRVRRGEAQDRERQGSGGDRRSAAAAGRRLGSRHRAAGRGRPAPPDRP